MGNTFGDMLSTKTKVPSEVERVVERRTVIISSFSENAH